MVAMRLAKSPRFRASVFGYALRGFVNRTSKFVAYSPRFKAALQATARPHYAYCMLNAADLALRLGKNRISAIEFGVAGGNGLAFMCDFAREIEREIGVAIDCFGFDTGQGMPPPENEKDLPYWFATSQYRMNETALRRRVPAGKLIIGDIKDTVGSFLKEYHPAPIGAIFNDTDYWSSTTESLRLFDDAERFPENFLPRIYCYFDDVIGSAVEMYGRSNGQLAAIDDFNKRQNNVAIDLNQNLRRDSSIHWRYQIYYAHLFRHPLYNTYIGGALQQSMETKLKLR